MNSRATSPEISSDQASMPGTYYLHARPEIVQLVPIEAQRILDVGCGAGGLSAALKARQSAEIHGVEIIEQAAEHARNHLDHVWNCGIEAALPDLPDGYYDCIIIADVLEHLLDPLFVISELKTKLTGNGKLIASIPNIQNWGVLSDLLQGKWDYRSEGILDRTHLRFFTRKSVREMFWNAGLRIAQLSVTRNGPPPPSKLLNVLKEIGLSAKELALDGQTFQFLIKAEVPDFSAKPKVSIVILNWNGKADTLECLASAIQLDYQNHELVVVDNGSTDDSVTEISKQYPDITLLQTGANLGYAGGNNVGIKWALSNGAEYILLLNNDTTIDSKLISAFVEAAQTIPDAGIFGAKIYFHDRPNILWFAGGRWLSHDMRLDHIGHGQKDSPDFGNYRECEYVTGCALFASAGVFREVGLLDEDFFLTYEETDWCYRARKKGYKCIVVPTAKLWHKVSASFGGTSSPLVKYFMIRNKLLWTKKHCTSSEWREVSRKSWQIARSILLPPFVLGSGNYPIVKRIVWSLASWWKILHANLSRGSNRAFLYGLRDFYFRKFGDCPAAVRMLSNPDNTKPTLENIPKTK